MRTTQQRSLDVIQVATPCTADWDAMHGDDRVRFCGHCRRHVHNLSAMTEDEATRLVCAQAGELCVRFSRDAKGRTLNYQSAPKRKVNWPFWTLLGAVAALGSWVVGVVAGVPGKTTRTMGAMVRPGYLTSTMGMPPPATLPVTPATSPTSVPTTGADGAQ